MPLKGQFEWIFRTSNCSSNAHLAHRQWLQGHLEPRLGYQYRGTVLIHAGAKRPAADKLHHFLDVGAEVELQYGGTDEERKQAHDWMLQFLWPADKSKPARYPAIII